MIIDGQESVTTAVLAELKRAPDARLREIMSALVRHLHDFAREVRLTEAEFERACAYIAALGQRTTASHNEVVLMAGSLGFSTLICLLNNGNNGQTETAANMLGPFWRLNAPHTKNGGSIVRSPTPGPALFMHGEVRDQAGHPIEGVEIDVWHSSPEGFYENQDDTQADMNLRGKFVTGKDGRFGFRSVKPAGYPIPIDGPVGEFIRAQGRHHYRPAHLHFLFYKPGFKTLISQVYVNGDPRLDTDVQFGVTRALVGNYVRHDEPAPAADVKGEWYSLDFDFVMEAGKERLPRAPIQ
ncbi:MAG TPA: dioxygenase [Xanthobacteraceae bacterium]|nr:dioxygenase [Xanthobacteraceae bacterium]